MEQHKDQVFLEYLVKSLAKFPDDVVVERKIDEMGVLLTLRVNREDMPQIVGRQGSTAKAIRSLLRIVGLKNNARVNLKILEPEGGSSPVAAAHTSDHVSDVDKAMEDLKNL
jgi:predicted RNA-binding protein YlqC (UPF0109 family)